MGTLDCREAQKFQQREQPCGCRWLGSDVLRQQLPCEGAAVGLGASEDGKTLGTGGVRGAAGGASLVPARAPIDAALAGRAGRVREAVVDLRSAVVLDTLAGAWAGSGATVRHGGGHIGGRRQLHSDVAAVGLAASEDGKTLGTGGARGAAGGASLVPARALIDAALAGRAGRVREAVVDLRSAMVLDTLAGAWAGSGATVRHGGGRIGGPRQLHSDVAA